MEDIPRIVRTGRKFDQVLSGARDIFMRDGFSDASMDDIARTAGVSKATLYSYFPDKRHLFIEVVTVECERMAEQTVGAIDPHASAEEVLTQAATHLVRFLVSDFAQRVYRICMAEADRFPELGRAYYASGPQLGHDRLTAYFKLAQARGEMREEDAQIAAEQFSELCKSRLFNRVAFGIQSDVTEDEIATVAREAVKTFMARFGAS